MKKLLVAVILFTVIAFLAFPFTKKEGALAVSVDELQQKIDEYTKMLETLGNQERDLKSQISLMTTKEQLTRTKISQTQKKIKIAEVEIATLSAKITRLDSSLDYISKVFISRINLTYKMGLIDPFTLLFSSKNIGEFLAKYKYLKVVQLHDRSLLLSMEETKVNYDEQKQIKEKIQKQLTLLKKQLEVEKAALVTQLTDRRKLLDETKGKEGEYQKLLAQAYAEKAAIENALVSGVKVGPVKRGDPIALVGNSGYPGCSTGKHLHFEIRKNNSWVDPGPYLSNKSVKDEQDNKGNINVGSGSWPWPIEDTVRLTQFYGQTPYSWRYKYSGGIHTGYDMVSTSSDVIRAPADGNLFKFSQMCGSSNINIVYIEHEDNVISFYLHVQ